MDFKQLSALGAVAETDNGTCASVPLNHGQQAVSRQLRLSAGDVGAELFERGCNGMQPTAFGTVRVEYARRVLAELDRARAEIRRCKSAIGGIIVFGLLPSTYSLVSSALVTAIAERHPGIRLCIAASYAGTSQACLEAWQGDVELLYETRLISTIRAKPLLKESLWEIGLTSSELRSGDPMPLAELKSRPLILPHGLRILVEHAAKLISLQLNVVAGTNAMSVQKSLVLGKHGPTIPPTIPVAKDLAAGKLTDTQLTQPVLVRKILLAKSSARHTRTPVKCVAAELDRCVRESVHCGWPGKLSQCATSLR
jgi:DNA-binding transcriptional LysR family regulator